jgi:hypothetical protein
VEGTEGEGDGDGLIDPAVAARLARARSGADEALHLPLGALDVEQVGVVEAEVVAIGLQRTFQKRSGGEGRLVKVALRDATGEADLVLWDEEVAQAAAWRPGSSLRLRGAVVKAGRDGPELGLGAARVEVVPAVRGAPGGLFGRLLALSPDRAVASGRVQAEAELATSWGLATLVVEGRTVAHLRRLPVGTPLSWPTARPHPVLAGWFLLPPDTLPDPLPDARPGALPGALPGPLPAGLPAASPQTAK